MAKIALLNPFHTGSHKRWAEGLIKHSKHQIHLFSLPGRHWKWRMHGAAIPLAVHLNKIEVDAVLTTDMLDLSLLKALHKQAVPHLLYCHENQLTYPWSDTDSDVKLQCDLHYAFINYSSALVADGAIFNSIFHRDSFLEACQKYLKRMPDERPAHTVESIKNKSIVIPPGIEKPAKSIQKSFEKPFKLLWNHRWEYDKNPDGFFRFLKNIRNAGIKFELILVGKQMREKPQAFNEIEKEFKANIVHCGYVNSRSEYEALLEKAHFLPVTSNQDFFGISAVEAMAYGVIPLFPNRLAFPEHVDSINIQSLLYSSEEEMKSLFLSLARMPQEELEGISSAIQESANKYAWSVVIEKFHSHINAYLA